jgi:hypothetical protein
MNPDRLKIQCCLIILVLSKGLKALALVDQPELPMEL